MEISESKSFAIFTTLGFIAAMAYAVAMGPGPEEGAQSVEQMALWEQLLLGYGLLAIFLNIFVAAFDAFSLGHRKWGWLCIFAWPISFVFVWLSALGYFRRQRQARGT